MKIDTVEPWSPGSWKHKPASQLPTYPNEDEVASIQDELSTRPPLVTSWEIHELKTRLAEAAYGDRFLLQGGDCAEQFDDCVSDKIANKLKIILQMSLVLVYGLKTPVVRVGRVAGQFAKPRSSPTETRGNTTLPSYRGDIINDPAFTEEARTPDPARMREAYTRAATTLNFIRALIDGGFADLRHPEYWDVDFMSHSPLESEYEAMLASIDDALRFVDTVVTRPFESMERAKLYTSHEALHLPYEEAMTRHVPHREGIYNLGTHFPWIGKRTAVLGEAHIEYMRGISNPVGLKVGPDLSASELVQIIRILDPDNEPGRLTLIHRFGHDKIEDKLPALIEAVQHTGRTPLWVCDPMHGNTEKTATGLKTRHYDNILSELEQAFNIHDGSGSRLGGVHFELTGDNVTECIGGARGLDEADLERAYESQVDPRLNYEQALEMAFSIVRKRRRLN